MTPEQHIKKHIIDRARIDDPEDFNFTGDTTAENIAERWNALEEKDAHWDYLTDMREGQEETKVPCDWSRHYESKSVAANIDGVWIGWTYWYGGGKHGEPGAVPWMEEAYFLDVKEEEKLVTIRTFTKQS